MSWIRKTTYAAGGAALGYLAWKALQESADIHANNGVARGKTFVVVGAGFAGLAVASELARLLPQDGNGDIVLIDEDDYLLFTPMLTEAAGGELDARHIVQPVRNVSKRIRFVQGVVREIDLSTKTVKVGPDRKGLQTDGGEYRADHLVIALGSVTNFHGIAGLEAVAIPMKRLQDASQLCTRVVSCLEQAATEQDDNKRKELLTFVVAGGGYTGVETMAALNDLVRGRLDAYPSIRKEEVRTLLINPGERLLMEVTADLAGYAAEKLHERGVELRMKTEVSGATGSEVQIKGGEPIPARTLVWAAGVKPSPVVEQLPCEKGKHGGLLVNRDCQLAGHPRIWALGDCAEIPRAKGKGSYAPTAQNATREGTLVARNILADLRGEQTKAFD